MEHSRLRVPTTPHARCICARLHVQVHAADAADWLSRHDMLSHKQFAGGHFALARYLDWSVVAVQHLCSVS